MSLPARRIPALPWEVPAADTLAAPSRLATLAGEILERCRGEGPPNCQARCPLHVDARRYVQLTKEGRFAEALQVVRERLPFPGVLGTICAHPCELHCKHIDDDSSVRIRDLKRFLAEHETGAPQHVLDRAPATGRRVAVVGAGPAGLLAAHDLARLGHAVTIFEKDDEIGGCLVQKIPEWRLPRAVVERDLSIIPALGIEIRTGVELGLHVTLDELRLEYQAVLLFLGFDGGQRLLRKGPALGTTSRGTLRADPMTCETGVPGVFAGGDGVTGPATVIDALATGRRAAESAHRFLTGRSIGEDREPTGPATLLWGLEVDEDERRRRERPPTMLVPSTPPLTEQEARDEAARCLDCTCGLCVKDCEFLSQHCASPKELARAVLTDPEQALTMTYSCNVCSLCEAVCPEHLDTGAMLLEARREAVRAGRGPLPQHKPIVSYATAGRGKLFTLAMPEPGRGRSKRLFFTGCGLPAASPANTVRVYDALRRNYPSTGVLMYCCGAPVELLGMEEEAEQFRNGILRAAEQLGAEELVAACPDCTHTLKATVPELTVTTVWEALAECWAPEPRRHDARIAIHDSCKARHEPATQAGVRRLIAAAGGTVEDVEYRGDKARCCGFGGMIFPVDPELSRAVTRRRAEESALPMVTYCAGCRVALAGAGKDSLHLLDFFFSDDWRAAAKRAPTGAVARYANRIRTKLAFKRLKPLRWK